MFPLQEAGDLAGDGRIARVVEEAGEMGAGERKQDVVHERNGRRRAFDVEQHRAYPAGAEREAHMPVPGRRGARYDGPKQSGWKPLSTPLSV